MAMGRREGARQRPLWIAGTDLATGPGHPFYKRLDKVLAKQGFDSFVEQLCEPLYATKMGRPSIPPGVYFRILLPRQTKHAPTAPMSYAALRGDEEHNTGVRQENERHKCCKRNKPSDLHSNPHF